MPQPPFVVPFSGSVPELLTKSHDTPKEGTTNGGPGRDAAPQTQTLNHPKGIVRQALNNSLSKPWLLLRWPYTSPKTEPEVYGLLPSSKSRCMSWPVWHMSELSVEGMARKGEDYSDLKPDAVAN